MAHAATKTADEIASNVKEVIDRILDADLPSQLADAGRDVASTVAEKGGTAAQRAAEIAKDAASGAERAWGKGLGRSFGNLWKRREVALGAAGAAVPASKELLEAAATRIGLRRREEAHWGKFFLGLVIGAIVGAAIALLATPRPGREIRTELAARAREAGDWVPVFQRGGDEEASEAAGGESSSGMAAGTGAAPAGPIAGAGDVPPVLAESDEETAGGTRR